MDYLNAISNTFNEHLISHYPELEFQELNNSERYPNSEGIKFESSDFAGEIFYYHNDLMEYCEMEFLIYSGEKHSFKIVEKVNLEELKKLISEFLTERITELKNVA